MCIRDRFWGAWRVAEWRLRVERPFLGSFLMTALGNPIVYLAAMGIGLASLVKADVAGVSYLLFVAPSLLIATVCSTSAGWGTWPIYAGFKWERSYLAASATPVEPGQIVQGEAIAVAARGLLQGLAFWLLGLPFGAWHGPWSLLIVPIGALAGLAFFAPLASYAATVEEEGLQFNLIQRLIVTPMFLFAGTFFPLESMPIYLQWIGWISPMWHGTQLSRVVGFGMPYPWWGVVGHLAFLVVITVGGMMAAKGTFFRRATK